MILLPLFALASAFSGVISSNPFSTQHPFYEHSKTSSPETLFSPPINSTQWSAAVNSLGALSSTEFTTLEHPAFPAHSVRIKRVKDWCDTTVKAYSGYIDFQARHLFFYFFESRNLPDTDPLMVWFQGGPGGSSSYGLFMELGPCSVDPHDAGKTVWNPHSWNNNASIFFLEQPVSVGFSYADYGIEISNTHEAAKDVYAFLFLFFEHFEAFKGRDFHIAGESYAGIYIPIFASEIIDNNPKAVEAGYAPINLRSALIGNGWTDWFTQVDSWYDIQCTDASYLPRVTSIADCVRMKTTLPRCKAMLQAECVDRYDLIGCDAAHDFCSTEQMGPYALSGRNPYDISKVCEGDYQETLCYPMSANVSAHLNLPSIRKKLGVDDAAPTFGAVSNNLHTRFFSGGDFFRGAYMYVAGLLERDVRVLIYAGDYDWIGNWIGNLKWTEKLEWTGHAAYNAQELKPWMVNGTEAGLTRAAKGLTYATIHGAGHMAPYDKPVEALAMVNKWLKDEDL